MTVIYFGHKGYCALFLFFFMKILQIFATHTPGGVTGTINCKKAAHVSVPDSLLSRSITREWDVCALVINPLSTHFYGQSEFVR